MMEGHIRMPCQNALDPRESRFRLAFAWGLLAACFLVFWSLAWDIQWHTDVGPETFFTAPHILLYAGAALGGLISLFVVVSTTVKYYHGVAGVSEQNTVPWLGLVRAPVGFIIAGLGTVTFILGGLYDLWWHTVFGFDVTLISPPHFALFLSGIISTVGVLYSFAAEFNRLRRRHDRGSSGWVVVGITLTLALLLAQFNFFLAIGLGKVWTVGPFILYALLSAIVMTPALVVAASFLPRPGIGTLTALCFALLRVMVLWLTPLATSSYAAASALAFKSTALEVSPIGVTMSPWLIAGGIVIDIALLTGERVRRKGWIFWAAVGAGAALAHHVADPRWVRYLEVVSWPPDMEAHLLQQFAGAAMPTLIAVPAVAALSGMLAWRLGIVLRYTDR